MSTEIPESMEGAPEPNTLAEPTADDYQASERLVYSLVRILVHDLSLEIPNEKFPVLKLLPSKHNSDYFQNGDVDYEVKKNEIRMYIGTSLFHTDIKVYLGNVLGEEIGHFFRSYFTDKIGSGIPVYNNPQEAMVQEFFGYLTRKLLLRSGEQYQMSQFMFDQEGVWKPKPRQQVMSELRGYRKKIRESFFGLKWLNRILFSWERVSTIAHEKGYRWADIVDVEKIQDWQKLFSMSDAEVKTRFFRDDQDYSGLGLESDDSES